MKFSSDPCRKNDGGGGAMECTSGRVGKMSVCVVEKKKEANEVER